MRLGSRPGPSARPVAVRTSRGPGTSRSPVVGATAPSLSGRSSNGAASAISSATPGSRQKALDLIGRGGLPDPVPQFQVRDGEFVAYIDIAWPEQMVAMECDSLAYHFGEVSHQGDRTRRRRLTLLGWDVYEYTYRDVTKGQATVLRGAPRSASAATLVCHRFAAPMPRSNRANFGLGGQDGTRAG